MSKLRQACVIFHPFAAREELSARRHEERSSDCWPDWSSEETDAETRAFAEGNTPGDVLRDIGWTCAYLVVLVGVIGTLVYTLSH